MLLPNRGPPRGFLPKGSGIGFIRSVNLSWAVVPVDHVEGLDITLLADGGALVMGHNWRVGSKQDFFVERISSSGESVWRRFETGRFARGISAGHKFGYFLSEFSGTFVWEPAKHQAAGMTDVVLGQVSLDGDLQWTRSISTAGADRATAVVATPDGGAAVLHSHFQSLKLGEIAIARSGGEDPIVSKWGDAGELEWALGFGWAGADKGSAIAARDTGELAVVGTRYKTASAKADSQQKSARQGWISLLDSSGAQEWLVTLGKPNGHLDLDEARWTSDGAIAVTGSFIGQAQIGTTQLETKRPSTFAALVSRGGKVLWAREVPPVACILAADDNAIAIVSRLGMLVIPQNGEPRKLHTWNEEAIYQLGGCASAGGGWIISGIVAPGADLGFGPLPPPTLRRFTFQNSPAFVMKVRPVFADQ